MSTIHEIEVAITKLKPDEVEQVANWLQEYREEAWDRQIEKDATTGRLDKMIAKAKAGVRDKS